MNSTPKREDGDGSTPASGARPSLEQTVLGVAPPPPPGAAPAGVPALPPPIEPPSSASSPVVSVTASGLGEPSSAIHPSAAGHPSSGALVPSVTITPSSVTPSSVTPSSVTPSSVTPSSVTPSSVNPSSVNPSAGGLPSAAPGAGAPAASADAASADAPAHPPSGAAGASIATAPVIAVSTAPVAVGSPGGGATAPARDVGLGAAAVGETLRIEPDYAGLGTPMRLASLEPPPPEPEKLSSREQTALASDYLREARAAALDDAPPRAPGASNDALALASTERAPLSAVAAAVPSGMASLGDTHRSVAPPLEPGPASTHTSSGSGASTARGFEPVPVVRAPLAESLSSALGPLAELGGSRHPLPPSSRPYPPPLPAPPREGMGRGLLLAAVALATVGVVSLGGRLWQRYRAHEARERAIASVEAGAALAAPSAAAPSSASLPLLASRPAPEPLDDGRVQVVSATPVAPPAGDPGASANPGSQLAATAARHVLSGNYAEALPLYRQLERSAPEITAYGAMARLLEGKVGSRNDTFTVTPAAPAPPRAKP